MKAHLLFFEVMRWCLGILNMILAKINISYIRTKDQYLPPGVLETGGVLCEDGVNPGYTAHGSVASEIRYISKDLYIFYDPEKESDKEILVYGDKFGPVGKVVLFDNNEIDE